MKYEKQFRIALLLPTVESGAFWLSTLRELNRLSERTILYTSRTWRGFELAEENTSAIQVVGKNTRVTANKEKTDYSGGFMYLSPNIIRYLFQFKPDVVFASGFSVWTILALILKPLGKWRFVIAWEGSSPNVDFRNSKFRLFMRSLMAYFADTLITNSNAGKDYLVEFLGVKENKIQVQPYLVPDAKALLHKSGTVCKKNAQQQHPIFLYVGRIEERKGLQHLLQACAILKKQKQYDYTLQIIGIGPQQEELENFCMNENLQDCVEWVGWVDYSSLGEYFRNADIFIFPSLEDTWGMVVLEAMAFGKPVLCSKWAGASEILLEGENSYLFDPYNLERLAFLMKHIIDNPNLIASMGKKSQEIISQHNPEATAQFFAKVSTDVLQA